MKLRTKVTLKELRSPPSNGSAKLTRSASIISALGRIRVTKGPKKLIDRKTCSKNKSELNNYRFMSSPQELNHFCLFS